MRSTRWLLASALLCSGSGCVTHALWTQTGLDNWNEPAGQPNLRLFVDGPRRDLLAVYDEYSERHDSIRTRAYWLYQNDARIARRHRPHFVSPGRTRRLTPIPIVSNPDALTDNPDFLCALRSVNGTEFTIYSGQRSVSSHELPTYNDGLALPARIALTPLTAAADATIIGGVIGLYWLAEGGWTELNHL